MMERDPLPWQWVGFTRSIESTGSSYPVAGVAVLVAVLLIPLLWSAFTKDPITRNGRPLAKPFGTLPLVGNGLQLLGSRHRLFAWFVECERRSGHDTLRIAVPTLPPGVLVNDPRALDFVFRSEGLFTKGQFVKERSWDLFGNGIINAEGDYWRIQRKVAAKFLSSANLRVVVEVLLPEYLAEACDHVKARAGRREAVDLQHVFLEINSRLIGRLVNNMDMHIDDPFTEAFDFVSSVTNSRFQNPLWRLTEAFQRPRFNRSMRTMRDSMQKIVQSAAQSRDASLAAISTTSSSPPSGEFETAGEKKLRSSRHGPAGGSASPPTIEDTSSGTLIHALMDVISNERDVADSALNYLSVGRDTTAEALTWAFYLLLRHHRRGQTDSALARLRAEVLSHVAASKNSSRNNSNGDSGMVSFAPQDMPYTMAVFYEAVRLYPPVPFEIRQCTRATTLPDGTFLPAGSFLVWCLWAMQRSRQTWGDDADEFRPERFLVAEGGGEGGGEVGEGEEEGEGERGTKKTTKTRKKKPVLVQRSAADFPAFHGGPRACLGRKIAEALAVQIMATLVWRFDFEPEDDAERVSRNSLTMPMEGGLPVFVEERDGAGRA